LRAAHAHPEALALFDEACRRARAGEAAPPYEARLVKADGQELTVRASIYPLTEAARVLAIEGVLVDISAEHAARTQLVQADRLSTLGRLAAGVAHEINNPAAFLMLGLEQLERLLGTTAVATGSERESTAAHKLLAQLTESLQRIVDIVKDLRLFAGPVQTRLHGPAPVGDINRAVQSAVTLTRAQLVERARLTVDLEPVPPGFIEQGRLAQVIVNLLVNAAQAIPKNGSRAHHIGVATRAVLDEIQIEITDTGTGIAPMDLDRIWAPFFTTKEAGAGTGLGLAISRDLIERAGGRIEVVSPALNEPHVGPIGSRFIIHLKRAPALPEPRFSRAARGSGAGSTPPEPGPRKRILVIEDELALGRALVQQLTRQHDVELVDCGAKALERLSAQDFDVILCDVRMPGMSGETVFSEACASRPERRKAFIFMTGIGMAADLARLNESYQCPILEKPFSTERLLRAIAELG
jgi:signal transduction histidine kinase